VGLGFDSWKEQEFLFFSAAFRLGLGTAAHHPFVSYRELFPWWHSSPGMKLCSMDLHLHSSIRLRGIVLHYTQGQFVLFAVICYSRFRIVNCKPNA